MLRKVDRMPFGATQCATLTQSGAGRARIFAEKISGAHADRPQLAKALAALTAGDCLVVCKLPAALVSRGIGRLLCREGQR